MWGLAVNHTELGWFWHLLQPTTWTYHRLKAQRAVLVFRKQLLQRQGPIKLKWRRGLWGDGGVRVSMWECCCWRWWGGWKNDGWLWVRATPWISSPVPIPLCCSPPVLHSHHVSPLPISLCSLCFPLSIAYSEAMERSCKCLLLLIQVSHPLPVEKEGDGQAEPLDESLSESLNLLSLLSLLLATIFLPCQSASDCSFYRSIHTYKHTTYEYAC